MVNKDLRPLNCLKWANACFDHQLKQDGIRFILLALSKKDLDRKPAILFMQAAKLFQKHRMHDHAEKVLLQGNRLFPEDFYFHAKLGQQYLKQNKPGAAIALLKPLHDRGEGDTVTAATLGNAYIHHGQPEKAIALLKPLHDRGEGDTVTAATLGNAYIHHGQPEKAITLLKPLHDRGEGDTVTAATLGNAYTFTKDRKRFDAIKASIVPESLRDYLDAKMHYLQNNHKEAMRLLQPHIEMTGDTDRIRKIPFNIVALFMSCIGNHDTSSLDALEQAVGKENFDYLIARRDEWMESPLRAEFKAERFSSSNILFALGGVAVSGADRTKAGLTGTGMPVFVRR